MHKVKNAIILAAGRGSRLKSLTDSTPKPLLKYNGYQSFIENIIKALNAKGIKDIYIVTGYLGDQFDSIANTFGCTIVRNNEWNEGNNTTSIKAAIEHLGDSIVVNGDVVLEENVFETEYPYSLTYVEKNKDIDEWIVNVDKDNNVLSYDKQGLGKEGYYQREITFITQELADAVRQDINSFDLNEYQEYLTLSAAQSRNIKFGIKEIKAGLVFDLDNQEEFNDYRATMFCEPK